jgi:hypothetical protein
MDGDRELEPIPVPSRDRRWDIDERGEGIADAAAAAGRIGALRSHAERPGWVAEEPEVHLWPHLDRAIHAEGSPWIRAEHWLDADGRLIVDLAHAPVEGDRARAVIQSEVLQLLGFVAESATFLEIDERRPDDSVVVDVVTGVLDDQSPFKAHGHTLRFRVTTGFVGDDQPSRCRATGRDGGPARRTGLGGARPGRRDLPGARLDRHAGLRPDVEHHPDGR